LIVLLYAIVFVCPLLHIATSLFFLRLSKQSRLREKKGQNPNEDVEKEMKKERLPFACRLICACFTPPAPGRKSEKQANSQWVTKDHND